MKPDRVSSTGVTGQDGSCLADLLFEKGDKVHGLVRPPEVGTLLADPAKVREELGRAAETTFVELVVMRVEADLEAQGRQSGRHHKGPGTR